MKNKIITVELIELLSVIVDDYDKKEN